MTFVHHSNTCAGVALSVPYSDPVILNDQVLDIIENPKLAKGREHRTVTLKLLDKDFCRNSELA